MSQENKYDMQLLSNILHNMNSKDNQIFDSMLFYADKRSSNSLVIKHMGCNMNGNGQL